MHEAFLFTELIFISFHTIIKFYFKDKQKDLKFQKKEGKKQEIKEKKKLKTSIMPDRYKKLEKFFGFKK